MSTMVYMKKLEQTPESYDRRMQLLTFGRIDQIKKEIASEWVEPGHRVLELGSGTGELAALMVARGAQVVGIDISEAMLATARKKAPQANFMHMTATELGNLGEGRFDRIVASLFLSELIEDEMDLVLRDSLVLLKPGGKLVIADEVPPTGWWRRTVAGVVRWPIAVVTFLLTQQTTHALKNLEHRLASAGFKVIFRKDYLLGTLRLVVAEKK